MPLFGLILAAGLAAAPRGSDPPALGDKPQELTGHAVGVSAVAFSPDGTTLASASTDGSVKLWDVGTGKCQVTFTGHGTQQVYCVGFCADRERIASAGADGMVRVWEATQGKELLAYAGHGGSSVHALAVPPGRQAGGVRQFGGQPADRDPCLGPDHGQAGPDDRRV